MKVRKIIVLIIMLVITLVVTGCGADIKKQILDDIASRGTLNQGYTNRLYKLGLISKEQQENLNKAISRNVAMFSDLDVKGQKFQNYLSWYIRGKVFKTTVSGEKYGFDTEISNTLGLPSALNTGKTHDNFDAYLGTGELTPTDTFQVVGGDYAEELKNMVGYNVMELQVSGSVSFDVLVAEINKAKRIAQGGKAESDEIDAELSSLQMKYFNKEGRPILTVPLIKQTVLGDENEIWVYSPSEPVEPADKIYEITPKSYKDIGQIGYDFRVRNAFGVPELTIRLEEYNPEAFKQLEGLDGIGVDEYLVHKRIILKLKYPINVIDNISIDTNDNTKYKVALKETDYFINLCTGEITDKDGYAMRQGTENIINIGGTGVQGEVGQSSFMLYKDNTGNTRVVLRDYLEYNYMKDVVADEKYVALGRRLRVEKLSGNINDKFATVIDKKGNLAAGAASIKVTDLMDHWSDTEGSELQEGYIIKLDKEIKDLEETRFDGENELKVKTKTIIFPVAKFGTENLIATNDLDAGTNGKIALYGLFVDKDPFTNGMYESWIEGTDTDFGNLEWWQRWLQGASYKYTIDANKIRSFLIDNYSYEMRKQGYIILDTDVISKIQQGYNADSKGARVTWIRTLFVIIGFIIMTYSGLIVGAWAFDSNIMSGPRFMPLLTFNKWEAISGNDELPQINSEEKQYMTFGATIRKCILMIIVGYLLTITDIVEIVVLLIDIFGDISNVITKMLFGNK